MAHTDCQYRFKIIMIGGNAVGKSWMLYRYKNGCFPEKMDVTIGVDFGSLILEVEPGVKVHAQILDTAGQERYWDMVCFHLTHSAGCLLVFDLSDLRSFDYIRNRYTELCEKVQPYTFLYLIVGHKCDIKERQVTQAEAEHFASELGAPYIETSAKTGQNVKEAFELLTRRIYQGYISGEVSLHESWGKIQNKKLDENKPNKDENNKCYVS